MRAITIFRGAAWFGFAVVVSALALVAWGVGPRVGTGPPPPFEREVVGAVLLALVAALSISISGRGDQPPSWIARGVAAVCAVSILVIAWYVYRHAHAIGFPERLGGKGWTWLLCGGGITFGAVVGTFGLKPPEQTASRKRGKRGKRKR